MHLFVKLLRIPDSIANVTFGYKIGVLTSIPLLRTLKIPAKDLLNDDFTNKFSLKCKKDAGPIGFTLETERGGDGSLSSKVGTKFSYAKFNVDKGQVKADGGGVLETSFPISPELKVYFKASKSADLIVDFVKDNLFATGSVDVTDLTKASGSACLALPSGIKVGGDVGYGFSGPKAGLNSVSAGFNYTNGPLLASCVATNKFSQVEVGLLYKVNPQLTLGSVTVHSSAKSCNVMGIGGSYKACGVGTIKAKWGMDQVLHACVSKEVAPKVIVVASASVTPTDFSTLKPGMSITF